MRATNKQLSASKPIRNQSGIALLEVLITFFVLAFGLLGLAALQVKSMQFNQDSYLRSQATVAAYDMLDRMRLNLPQVKSGAYNTAYGSSATSTVANPAGGDLTAWITFLNNTFPGGDGYINCNNATVCTVKVKWTDRINSTSTNTVTEEFVTTSKL
ncbi:MAG TPA: type IV pilus modification protein PilV [Pseudomonadales bacterium]|nr:type IV pilus modification protein PilV [Pseudomonadales bacterium]